MNRRQALKELHPAVALGGAVFLHAVALWMIAKPNAARSSADAGVTAPPTEIDVTLLPPLVETPSPRVVDEAMSLDGRGRKDATHRNPAPAVEARGSAQGESSHAASATDGGPDGKSVAPAAPPGAERGIGRSIDLGLGGGLTRAMVLEQRDRPPSAPKQSAGLLKEGLAALDAQRGVARSAPALAAARGAALELAPRDGTAVFEVVTNASGEVTSVALVSAAYELGRWESVVESMRRRLRRQRLRMPPGSRGLLARVRVDRGDAAKNVEDLYSLERGAALGQAPLDHRQALDESTQASQQPGQLTPTLGVSSATKTHPTRVSLLSEQIL